MYILYEKNILSIYGGDYVYNTWLLDFRFYTMVKESAQCPRWSGQSNRLCFCKRSAVWWFHTKKRCGNRNTICESASSDVRVRQWTCWSGRIMEYWILSRCILPQTSRILDRHRQTVLYQLGKIEEYTGMSLKSYDDLYLLETCIRLHFGLSISR